MSRGKSNPDKPATLTLSCKDCKGNFKVPNKGGRRKERCPKCHEAAYGPTGKGRLRSTPRNQKKEKARAKTNHAAKKARNKVAAGKVKKLNTAKPPANLQ